MGVDTGEQYGRTDTPFDNAQLRRLHALLPATFTTVTGHFQTSSYFYLYRSAEMLQYATSERNIFFYHDNVYLCASCVPWKNLLCLYNYLVMNRAEFWTTLLGSYAGVSTPWWWAPIETCAGIYGTCWKI